MQLSKLSVPCLTDKLPKNVPDAISAHRPTTEKQRPADDRFVPSPSLLPLLTTVLNTFKREGEKNKDVLSTVNSRGNHSSLSCIVDKV